MRDTAATSNPGSARPCRAGGAFTSAQPAKTTLYCRRQRTRAPRGRAAPEAHSPQAQPAKTTLFAGGKEPWLRAAIAAPVN